MLQCYHNTRFFWFYFIGVVNHVFTYVQLCIKTPFNAIQYHVRLCKVLKPHLHLNFELHLNYDMFICAWCKLVYFKILIYFVHVSVLLNIYVMQEV